MHASFLCAVATNALDLNGHIHGDGCGHPAVEHGDHHDFLVRVLSSARSRLQGALPNAAAPLLGSTEALRAPHGSRARRRRRPEIQYRHLNAAPLRPCGACLQVNDELHHVSDSCCPHGCCTGPIVVSHGLASTLKHRWARRLLPQQAAVAPSSNNGHLPAQAGRPRAAFRPLHRPAAPPLPTTPAAAPPRRRTSQATAQERAGLLLHEDASVGGGSRGVLAVEAGGVETPLLQTTRVFAAGICCPMETPLIHSILDAMPGVHSVRRRSILVHFLSFFSSFCSFAGCISFLKCIQRSCVLHAVRRRPPAPPRSSAPAGAAPPDCAAPPETRPRPAAAT